MGVVGTVGGNDVIGGIGGIDEFLILFKLSSMSSIVFVYSALIFLNMLSVKYGWVSCLDSRTFWICSSISPITLNDSPNVFFFCRLNTLVFFDRDHPRRSLLSIDLARRPQFFVFWELPPFLNPRRRWLINFLYINTKYTDKCVWTFNLLLLNKLLFTIMYKRRVRNFNYFRIKNSSF